MHDARVLVVDDSAAMRALFSDILDQAKGVSVVGASANASEALKDIETLRPNVLTLDVEMPGMNGIELLQHIMDEQPMPVVMLSSLTQSGTETSLKAIELGAVECFPKPLKATPEQFAKIVGKLGKIVHSAANSNVRERRRPAGGQQDHGEFTWGGQIVAIGAAMGGIDAVSALLSCYPANCPPTLVTLQAETALAQALVRRLDAELPCSIAMAEDGAPLIQGSVHIAADPERHAILEPGTPPRIRLMARDPVDEARPSATLLFGTIARAGVPAVGVVVSGMGTDGARGLKLMRDAGGATFVQSRASAMISEAPNAVVEAGAAQAELGLEELAAAMLGACSQA